MSDSPLDPNNLIIQLELVRSFRDGVRHEPAGVCHIKSSLLVEMNSDKFTSIDELKDYLETNLHHLHCGDDNSTFSDRFHLIPIRATESPLFNEEKFFAGMSEEEITPLDELVRIFAERYNSGNIEYAKDYGEPGYSLTSSDYKGILFSNWNNFSVLANHILEHFYECEWSDEWIVLHDEGSLAYRTQSDSYGWQSSLVYLSGEYSSWKWALENAYDLIMEEFSNDPANCITCPNTALVQKFLTDNKFTKLNDHPYEVGLHKGMDDLPDKIFATLDSTNNDHLFIQHEASQFYMTYDIYQRSKQTEED